MDNLTWCAHVPAKYGAFWKIISIRKLNLKFVLLVRTFWQLCETSEFCIVSEELGVNSTCLHVE